MFGKVISDAIVYAFVLDRARERHDRRRIADIRRGLGALNAELRKGNS